MTVAELREVVNNTELDPHKEVLVVVWRDFTQRLTFNRVDRNGNIIFAASDIFDK